MRLERELDSRRLDGLRAGLPAECKAIRRLNSLDHATIGPRWSSRAVPPKDDLSAWTQIDGRLRPEPGAELVRPGQRGPDALRRRRQDELAFDRVRDLHGHLPALINPQLNGCRYAASAVILQPIG